ncbi:hypothetical protein D3C80_2102650 [compost metagenome]
MDYTTRIELMESKINDNDLLHTNIQSNNLALQERLEQLQKLAPPLKEDKKPFQPRRGRNRF